MGVHEAKHQVSEAAGQIWRVPIFGRYHGVTAEQESHIVRAEDIGDELLGGKPDDTVCYVTQHDHPVFFAKVCKKKSAQTPAKLRWCNTSISSRVDRSRCWCAAIWGLSVIAILLRCVGQPCRRDNGAKKNREKLHAGRMLWYIDFVFRSLWRNED